MVLILATNSFATKDVAFIYLYSKKKLVAPTKPSVFVYKGLGGRATRHLCYFPEYIFLYIKNCIWPAFHFHWITMGEEMKAIDLSRYEQNLCLSSHSVDSMKKASTQRSQKQMLDWKKLWVTDRGKAKVRHENVAWNDDGHSKTLSFVFDRINLFVR